MMTIRLLACEKKGMVPEMMGPFEIGKDETPTQFRHDQGWYADRNNRRRAE